MEKTRSIDNNLKENQHKINILEKNMDLLERDHDVLKDDFERTSTGWTKNRMVAESGGKRREDRLNDTRVTNKSYY
jgi:hypothetical protein